MITETTRETNSWQNKLLTPEQAALIGVLFPFKTPTLEVARDYLLITDPELQMKEGYHDTSSKIFLHSRPDRRLLVPAEAFGKDHPEFDLAVIVTHTIPVTKAGYRRWAVWCSRIPYTSWKPMSLGFTPEKARETLAQASEIKDIFQKLLNGSEPSTAQERLRELTGAILRGEWYRYYTEKLPETIYEDKDEAERVINKTFAGLDYKIKRAIKYWGKLTPEEQNLLAQAFRVVVKAKFQEPYVYASSSAVRENTVTEEDKLSKKRRDPLEMIGRTQGVLTDDVEAVYIPDDIFSSERYPPVLERMEKMGIADRVKPFSDLDRTPQYPTCDKPYEKFNLGLLIQYIRNKKMIPLIPSEWENNWPLN